jgi:hypothetical protein
MSFNLMCKKDLSIFLMTTTVVTTILLSFSFQKEFLIRNACELRALWQLT